MGIYQLPVDDFFNTRVGMPTFAVVDNMTRA